jgi:isoaspartyl peptidase/L-asparaginase-like protein (Ntn-hydrolase superfamily)
VRRIAKFLPKDAEDQVGFLALRADGQVGAWAIRSGFNYALRDASGARLIDVACERKEG